MSKRKFQGRLLGRAVLETLEARQLMSSSIAGNFPRLTSPGAASRSLASPGPIVKAISPSAKVQLNPAAAVKAAASVAPLPLTQTFQLHSSPESSRKIYLDFDGGTVTDTAWNDDYGPTITVPAFNFEGDGATFTDNELARIQAIWARVAEDYAPWQVDVTTQDPGFDGLNRSSYADTTYGSHVMVGGDSNQVLPGLSAGGVAYVDVFSSVYSKYQPAFAFSDSANSDEKFTADAIVHEVGHNLGLSHDGRTSPFEAYYEGHGTGATSWAPVMGVGYYKNLVQFSKGEYLNASQKQDDLSIITTHNGFGYRKDDYGNSLAGASVMPGDTGGSVNFSGIISQTTDTDWLKFTTAGGSYSFAVSPSAYGANLDVRADLYDASGKLVVSSNPVNALNAALSGTLVAGTYYLKLDGVGKAATATDPGYSDYGSLGVYSVKGNYMPASAPTRILGQVFNDQNDNGIKDAGDTGLSGWTVYLDTNGNKALDASEKKAISDASGNYVFSGLAAGSYTIREIKPKEFRQTYPFAIEQLVTLASGQTVVGKDFGNTQKIRIAGMKFNDLNASGAIDVGEPGLAGWTIYLDSNNNNAFDSGEMSQNTDAKGNYMFSNLPAGTYTIRETSQSGWRQTSPAGGSFTIAGSAGQFVGDRNFGDTQQSSVVGTPTNLRLSENNSTQVRLLWDHPGGTGLAGFRIQYSRDGASWTTETNSGSPDRRDENITGLSAGTLYFYRVQAVAGPGYTDSGWSNVLQATTPAIVLPVPTNLRVLGVTSTSADLAWDEVSGESSYTMQVSTDGGSSWSTQENVPADHGYKDTVTLSPSRTYWFRVVANYGTETSGPSNVVQVNTLAPGTPSPTNLRVLSVGPTSADLAWDEVSGESSYTVQVSTDGGSSWNTQENVPADHGYKDTVTLIPNRTYWFRVVANYSHGTSLPSNVVQVTTPDRVALSNLRVLGVGPTSADLAWDEVDGESSYTMQVSTDGGSSWTTQENVPADHAYKVTVSLSPNRTYWFRAVANFPDGSKSFSNVVQLTTPSRPAPTNLRVLAIGTTSADLAWDEVSGESSYTMQVSTDGGSSWSTQENVPADHAYKDTVTLLSNRTYWFRVVANYGDGTSAPSNVVQLTTLKSTLPAPANLRVLAIRSTEIDLAWNEVSGEDSYTVQVSTNGIDGWRTQENVPANHGYKDTVTVLANRTYWFRVVANNSYGAGDPSNVVKVTTPR